MSDYITDFLAAMAAAGFVPKGPFIADDKWHPAYYGDERGSKCSGTYSLLIEADHAKGCFFTRKDENNKIGWHSQSDKKLFPAELKKIKKDLETKKREKEEIEDARHRKIADRLTKYYKKQLPAQAHPYLEKKRVHPHNIKIRKKHNELIVPLYGQGGKVFSIQRITASGGKYLFAGGRKQGCYFPFCTAKEDLSIILLCEGFSTGASIREATNLPVFSAIDSGNLKPVHTVLKAKYPKSKFIICADNDSFTKNAKGEPWNVGIEKAKQAAEAVGGAVVVWPLFEAYADSQQVEEKKLTDFNDLQEIAGSDEVKRQIMEVVSKVPATQEIAVVSESQPVPNQPDNGDPDYSDYGERDYEAEAGNLDPNSGDFGMNYKVLGYNKGLYYYFPFKERQIVALTASAHTLPNLFRLDNLENWMDKFGAGETSEKKVTMYATNALMELAKHRGVFKEEDRVRGCGAWLDEGRKILHCGDVLYVDGVETKFDQLKSEYTYIAAVKLMRPTEPLNAKEAHALRLICEGITWENKLSGSLLAGWLVIAPVCGALPFRPHVYITGEAESGKSTVLNRIIKPVLGRMAVRFDGGTTEPAVREAMEYDARPLVYDEAEKSIHMPGILELARKASTGGTVKKFGQGLMNVRFCACFSAINPPVNKTADESRIAFMVIKKNRRSTAMQEYEDLIDAIEKTITPDYSSRMISRTLQNMGALFENIKTFQRAARKVIKGARASEVIGAMLAGLYLLHKTDIITLEFAEKWVAEHDWTAHTIVDEDTDPVKLLQYLSSCVLRLQMPGITRDVSIGDLIVMAHSERDMNADKLLRYSGIAVKDGKVYIASRSQSLEKLLRDTDWSMKWTRMLSNIEGAEPFKIFYFGVGVKTSGVSLPIKIFTDKERKEPAPIYTQAELGEEIPF